MSHKKVNKTKSTLTMSHKVPDFKSTSTITLTKDLLATINRIKLVVEGLTGLDVAISVLLARAAQSYEADILALLHKAVRLTNSEKPLESTLLNLQADIQDERAHLFETANRTKDAYRLLYGHIPTIEEITGHNLDEPRAAHKLTQDLGKLASKLKTQK